MKKITDIEMANMIGMTYQNLQASYKRHPNEGKRLMYRALKIGLIAIRDGELPPEQAMDDKLNRIQAILDS